MMSYVRF